MTMTRLFLTLITTICGLGCLQNADAQQPPELSTQPLLLGETGVSVRVPVGSRAQSTRIGVQGQAKVAGPDGAWLLTVRTAVTRSEALTPLELAAAALQDLSDAHGYVDGEGNSGTLARAIEPISETIYSGLPAARFVLRAPSATGGDDIIRAYAAARTGAGRFVVFEMSTLEPDLEPSLAAFDAVAASLDVSEVTRGEVSRAAAVRAGQIWLSALAPDALDRALDAAEDDWFRLYRPAAGGNPDEELGYQRFQAFPGSQDDLNEQRRSKGGRKTGVVVELVARSLQPTATGRMVVDAKSAFWHSNDAEEEAWTVRLSMTETDGLGRKTTKPETWKTLGARTGDSMSVNIEDSRRSIRSIRPQILGEGYITRGMSLLLPRLYGIQATPGTYGFYVYRSDAEAVVLRRDVVTLAEDGTEDVLVETLLGPDKPVQRSRVSPEGVVRWIELADGSRWEPTTLDQLVALWRSKGLPLD